MMTQKVISKSSGKSSHPTLKEVVDFLDEKAKDVDGNWNTIMETNTTAMI